MIAFILGVAVGAIATLAISALLGGSLNEPPRAEGEK